MMDAMAFSPDGQLLATASGGLGRIYLWKVRRALDPEVLSGRARETATAMLASVRSNDTRLAHYLVALAPHAKAAVPILIEALNDPEPRVRSVAVAALARIHSEPEAVVPALTNALGSDKQHVRLGAAELLGTYAASAKPAVPMLCRALADTSREIQRCASDSLVSICHGRAPTRP